MNKEILEITKKFHDTYEKMASEYSYETRENTKVFDINSNNGKLMYATVNEIVSPILKENKELKKQLKDKTEDYKRMKDNFDSKIDVLTEIDTQQKEFISYLEDEINKLKEQIKNYDIWHEVGTDINFLILKKQFYLEILQKYQEIEGSDSNVKD